MKDRGRPLRTGWALLKPTREPSSSRRQRRGDWWTLLTGGRGLATSGSRGGADVPEALAPEEPV